MSCLEHQKSADEPSVVESMSEAMALFIQYTEEIHGENHEKRAEEYTKMLMEISSGTWEFPADFQKWQCKLNEARAS
jgi:hypothetical protein